MDVLFEYHSPISLFDIARIEEILEGALGRRVDLVPRSSLKPLLRERVLAEATSV